MGAAWAAGVAALLLSRAAASHTSTALAGGIVSGFKHPFTGVDHMLAMISVGLWGAFLGRPLIYTLPVIFPLVMAGGAIIGMLGICIPSVEVGVALSVLVLGECITLSLRAPVWAASLMVATFALFHGYAHGHELPSVADPIGYCAGFVVATGVLHVIGIGLGLLNEVPGGVWATRAAGVVISAAGLWFLYKAAGL